jgi:hypothetical protein
VVSFDNLDKDWLVQFVEHRVADPRILRLIQKWLNAGVMEESEWSNTKTGSPQSSVISPVSGVPPGDASDENQGRLLQRRKAERQIPERQI